VVNFFFQAEDGIRDRNVTGVQTCALPILRSPNSRERGAGSRWWGTASTTHPPSPARTWESRSGRAPTSPSVPPESSSPPPTPAEIGRATSRERAEIGQVGRTDH